MKRNILRISILVVVLVFFIYSIILLAESTEKTTMYLFDFGQLSDSELFGYTSVSQVNNKYYFPESGDYSPDYTYDTMRQYSGRNMCIHFSSHYDLNADGTVTKGGKYVLTDIVDISLNKAVNITNSEDVISETNAALTYIAYYGTVLDMGVSERGEDMDTSAVWVTLTGFRSLYTNSEWRECMQDIGVPTYTEVGLDGLSVDDMKIGNGLCSYDADYATHRSSYDEDGKLVRSYEDADFTYARAYAAFIDQNQKNGKLDIKKGTNASGEITPTISGEFVGPFKVVYAEYPKLMHEAQNYYGEATTINDDKIKNQTICKVDGHEYSGSYYSSTDGTVIGDTVPNNQQFYIKTSVTSQVKFINSFNSFEARIFVFEGGSLQSNITMIGKSVQHSSYVEYEFNNTPEVAIQKEIYYINGSAPTNNKSANVEPGDTVIFKVTVTNSGASKNVRLTDVIPTGLKLESVGMPNGGTISWTAQSSFSGLISSSSDITRYFKCTVNNDASGTITNKAVVSAMDGSAIDSDGNKSKEATATVTVLGYDYSISKTTTKTVYEYGEEVTFTVTVTNEENTSIKNIVVQDNIPSGLTYKSFAGTNWTKSTDNQTFTYSGTIAGKGTASFSITYTINPGTNSSASTNEVNIAGKSITNTATITQILNRNGVSVIKTSGNTATKTITVNGYHYKIEKTVNKAEAEAGDTLTYTVTVSNLGTTKIKNIKVTDELPTGLDSVTFSGTGWSKSGNIYSYANVINGSGGTATFTISGNVGNGYIQNSNTSITNRATLTNITNNSGTGLIFGIYSEVTTEVLGYNATLSKYIIKHNGTDVSDRTGMNDTQKNNSPVVVKQGDTVIYRISLENTGAGKLYNPQIVDALPTGLKFIEYADMSEWSRDEDTNTYTYNGTVRASSTINLDIKCQVTMSNMYLPNITNTATYGTVSNKNGTNVKDVLTTGNNKDYIRLDELDISGTVWEDTNKDGLLDSTDENGIEGIEVILYDATNSTEYDTTTTNSNGYYSFSNVIKGKDFVKTAGTTGYYSSNDYKEYYVEFKYNGITYQSTKYTGENTNKEKGQGNLTGNGNYDTKYTIDSNAAEKAIERGNFNKSLERISYNLATGNGSSKELSYTKNEKISTINLTDNTAISAYSFMDTTGDRDNLWLYKTIGTDEYVPQTDYLNYINLGLTARDGFDLSLINKVEEIETIVNGQSMKYNFSTSNINSENKFSLYKSDYAYRYDSYIGYNDVETNLSSDAYKAINDIVKGIKGLESELNIFVKFKTTVTNNSTYAYAKVNEIAHFYDTNFKEYDGDDIDEDVDTIKYWLDGNNNGCIDSGETMEKEVVSCQGATIKNTSDVAYNDKELTDLNVIYTNLNDMLAPGESKDIYITYIVDKNPDSARTLRINDGKTGADAQLQYISIIGQYSSYEDGLGNIIAGLIDDNSNPGNLGLTGSNTTTDYVKNTEDSNKKFESGTKQYSEKYFENDTDISVIQFIFGVTRKVSGLTWLDERNVNVEDGPRVGNGKYITSEPESESGIEGITVQLVEIIKDNNNYYEIIRQETHSTSGGDYVIEDFIPGNYIVRFRYGGSDSSIEYNGQDYKSTTYGKAETYGDLTKTDRVSDARDDELRRLEVMNYSIEMYNEKAEILKGVNTSDKEQLKQNTNMFADTMQFFSDYELLKDTTGSLLLKDSISFDSADKWKVDGGIDYNRAIDYTIPNIDFGIQERPINEVELQKYIKEIKLETSTGDLLVDLHYDVYKEDDDGNKTLNLDAYGILQPKVDASLSKGFENVQSLNNTSTQQGFRYINIDEDLLQGAKITITYGFIVTNNSEKDYISSKLYGSSFDSLTTAEAVTEMKEAIESLDNLEGKDRETEKVEYEIRKNNYKYLKPMIDGTRYSYGYYLGGIYYTGVKTNDVQATIKIDNILDYVDNNLVYSPSENKGWSTINETELFSNGYLNPEVGEEITLPDGTNVEMVADINHIQFQTETKNNLAITIDDNTENPEFSKFIEPGESVETELEVSTILSAENESDDMEYHNIAEIIKFTTLTGRRTVDTQTVGNAKVNLAGYKLSDSTGGTLEEADTSIVERITLTPPTGYTPAVKTTKMIIYIIAAIVVVGAGVYFTPKLISIIKNRKFIK